MPDVRGRVDELVELMEEHGLESAEMSGSGWAVKLSRHGSTVAVGTTQLSEVTLPLEASQPATSGTAVTSPTTGIFYSSPSPGSPTYVKPGETVVAGQIVGLIEAMKVFNEITAPTSGIVQKIAAENGQLVHPGDPLVYIG